MFKQNRNLLIIGLIAFVNMLGYGIIIPIQYNYTKYFNLNLFQFGLIFALFSICQFVAAPIIGRLSDKYGRRPMLIGSLAGTAISFLMMAFAPSALVLYLARALDGLTAGNIPVAASVISDTTSLQDRAKGFGIMSAAFGFGFVFGPAISGLTIWLANQFGIFGRAAESIPFIIAALISLGAAILTGIYLPETNKHIGAVKSGKLFDFRKLWSSLFDEKIGITLMITLFYSLAFALFIYVFQAFTQEVIKFTLVQSALLFTLFGLVGSVTQLLLVQKITTKFGLKKTFSYSMLFIAVSFLLMFLSQSMWLFIIACVLLSLSNSLFQPLIQTILSRETDEKSQGTVMGINASYMSIGNIIGPIAGGAIATVAIGYPFLAASLLVVLCFILSFQVLKPGVGREHAF